MTRILFVSYEWPGVTDNCGGGGQVSKELRDGLEARGHTVYVETDWEDGNYLSFPARSYNRVKECLRRKRIDVVHGHFSLPSSLALPRLAEEHDVPLVVTLMGSDLHNPVRFGTVRPLLNVANRYVFSRSDCLVAPSTDMRKRLPGPYVPRATVVPHGIDPERWDWRRRDIHDPVRVLTVCRQVGRKNIDTAVQVLRTLRLDGYDVEYRVVGTGPDPVDVDQDWVDRRGYVPDVEAEYDWADLFFLPTHYEAFGMVFLEALECGLPVVTSNSGGQTDIVTDAVGSSAAAPTDVASLVTEMESVIDHYDSLQRATEGYVDEHFSRDRMVSRYEQTYREVMQ